jgi:LysM repeat protein
MWNNFKDRIHDNFTFVLMKSAFTLILLLALTATCGLFAQQKSDTIPYKIGSYDIKKQQTVLSVANKLKVDPKTIVRLNKLRSIQQDLVEGQRIKIPVYPKGFVYEADKDYNPVMPKLDSAQASLIYSDTVKARPAPVQEVIVPTLPAIDKEEAEARLMMIDAITELNEAMLQGVKASIDTLNAEKEFVVDDKNIQVMLIRMKRARDKVLLMPYLEHIQDSLTKEVKLMQEEKAYIVNLLNPQPIAAAPIISKDTVVAGADMVVYQTTTFPETGIEEKVIERVISTEPITAQVEEPATEPRKIESRKRKEKLIYCST